MCSLRPNLGPPRLLRGPNDVVPTAVELRRIREPGRSVFRSALWPCSPLVYAHGNPRSAPWDDMNFSVTTLGFCRSSTRLRHGIALDPTSGLPALNGSCVQFIRIVQLQAQLDVVLGALRRSPDGVHV
jgi:hypothetical protein